MILEIIRQAIEIKLRCSTEAPLISPGEYCCACGMALRILGNPSGLLEEARKMETISQLREKLDPVFEKALEVQPEEAVQNRRLFHMLLHSRAEGPVTEEIRPLFDPPGSGA